MKKTLLSLVGFLALSTAAMAQTVKDANVAASNVEENMFYTQYDPATKTLQDVNFMILSEGDNTANVLPAFSIKLYLYQEGKAPIYIQTYAITGMHHLDSRNFQHQNINLSSFNLSTGLYSLGLSVDTDDQIKNDRKDDNMILFKDAFHVN